ncbi:MAG: RibD family protein [Deltaproteobacteria bacterium]|nr:RibD family protein [Deltaproteobacteria bacterium]
MPGPAAASLDRQNAWALLLELARRAGSGSPVVRDVALRLGADGSIEEGGAEPWIVARPGTERGWSRCDGTPISRDVELVLDLYMPLCVGAGRDDLTIAHLAQTLDGRVAIASGESQFITGEEDLAHCHRLRALSDVVVVGRHTVEADDPQLTTRLCTGRSPVRAVIDPARRLADTHRVFRDDAGGTLLFCASGAAGTPPRYGGAEVIALDAVDGKLPVQAIVAELRRRGLRRIYVEGGGVTVSRFIEAGALTRLQVTIAPMLFGSGRPAVTLREIRGLSEAVKLRWRHFALGRDVLFDCEVGS